MMNIDRFAPTALCVLSRSPNRDWIQFLTDTNAHLYYDVYILVDTPGAEGSVPTPTTHNINIIHIPDDKCRQNNYYNSSTASNLKDIVAWDKSLYYFNRECKVKYPHIWFIEDDVFFAHPMTLQQIDSNHSTADILSSFHERNDDGRIHGDGCWNHWVNVAGQIELPWSHSLISACRMSSRLLQRIDEYVRNRPLMFIEALFPTLALHNHYCIETPAELANITYDRKWEDDEICDPSRLYHPMKNTEKHAYYRTRFIQTEKFI